MPQRTINRVITNPPPVQGLNTTGAVAAMKATEAVGLDNFISTDLGLQLREGWSEYATGLGGRVRTIMSYEGSPVFGTTSPLDASQMFAVTDNAIWDIEGGGSFSGGTPDKVLSGASFAGSMSFVQFTTAGGKYLIACSETDGGFLYNGTTWMKMAPSGTAGPGVVTGIDPARFVQVVSWKKRLMFVERDSTKAWILPVDSVGGAATMFDFGPLMRFGGMLLALVNWTQDAGQGMDDRLVVLGSSGDVAIYEGTDPTNAAAFRNVGVWYVGRSPTGRRCFTTAGGNVMILSSFGVIPLTLLVQGGLDTTQTSDTESMVQMRKLQSALNSDFASLINTPGWEIMYFPTQALLHIARPSLVSGEYVQYVFHMHSNAWSRLLDVPAVTFGRRLTEWYGGTDDGRVLRCFMGNSDGMLLNGTGAHEIRGLVTPAFSYFGDPTTLKQALMMRVNFVGESDPGYVLHMNLDFAVRAPGAAPLPGSAVGSLWGTAIWGLDFWGGGRGAYGEWRSIEGMGYSMAPTIYVANEKHTTIANIEYMVKAGGPL